MGEEPQDRAAIRLNARVTDHLVRTGADPALVRAGPRDLRGVRVGLYGGTFDPPHEGHLALARTALVRLGLDRLWWLPAVQNPLKARSPAPFADRLLAVRAMISGERRMAALDLEARIGARASIDTVRALQRRWPGARFVWLLGADSLAGLHRWRSWRALAGEIPIAAFARPGFTVTATLAPGPAALSRARIQSEHAHRLGVAFPPAWTYIPSKLSPAASSALRPGNGATVQPAAPPETEGNPHDPIRSAPC